MGSAGNEVLSNEEIGRYSRQMILPEIGMEGQKKLKNSSVLIVGLGGLGSPASIFLAAAGVGKLGLVDFDCVEISNLHRQIIHSEQKIGISKAESAKQFIKGLNSNVKIEPCQEPFTSGNAMSIVKSYDVVLDCTDNAATRYLLNDACVLSGKPLISGSALRFEGQLTTYNLNDGPCYRCIFPVPPPPEFVTNCSDGGVLGVVPGIIGNLQALEAIKYVCGIGASYSGKLLLFDGIRSRFNEVKLRTKQPNCSVCGSSPTILELLDDYPMFCGAGYNDKEKPVTLLNDDERITPSQYKQILEAKSPHFLLDVREPQELEICSLPVSIKNIPYSKMNTELTLESLREEIEGKIGAVGENIPVYVVCRRGNDSQRAVKLLQSKFDDLKLEVKDIKGGLHQWSRDVDPSFPIY